MGVFYWRGLAWPTFSSRRQRVLDLNASSSGEALRSDLGPLSLSSPLLMSGDKPAPVTRDGQENPLEEARIQ